MTAGPHGTCASRTTALFREVLLKKNLGLGEGYMLGWWDCERVDEFICRVLKNGAADRVRGCWRLIARLVPSLLVNLQSLSRARIVARRHYDLGNDLFQAFLDSYLQYSCAYFKGMACEPDPLQLTGAQVSRDLETAQQAKMRLICEKLELKPGETLLDIGCGWGGLARFAAENYGCTVTGVNISRRQIEFAREFCKGLPVEIRETDYRLLGGNYDKIVSVGMFEHVGYKNYRTFMETAARCLAPDGAVPAPHHRQQRDQPRHRPLDLQIHLPQRRAAEYRPDIPGRGEMVRG